MFGGESAQYPRPANSPGLHGAGGFHSCVKLRELFCGRGARSLLNRKSLFYLQIFYKSGNMSIVDL